MVKWEYTWAACDTSHIGDTRVLLQDMGEQGWEAWDRNSQLVFFKRPIEEETSDEVLTNIFPKPDKVVVNDQGEGWPPTRARAAGVYVGTIFIRKDGWSLGAPKQFMDVAESLWADEWLVVICGTEIMPYKVYKQRRKEGFIP